MKQNKRGQAILSLVLMTSSVICCAEKLRPQGQTTLTPQQTALIEKASTQEKSVVKAVRQHAPLVQTYIQHMQSDPKLGRVPSSDRYILGRVSFDYTFSDSLYKKAS